MARTKDFDEAEVLNKAVCLFWHKGYNGTSMQDLIDSLGISRSSLYDTFGDKYTLYIRSLGRYQADASARMQDILDQPVAAKQAVRQLLELAAADLLNDQQNKGCFQVNAEVELATHDAKLKELVQAAEQELEDAFYLVIARGQESGEINSTRDARTLARFMLNTTKGMRVSAKSVEDRTFFNDIISTALGVLE